MALLFCAQGAQAATMPYPNGPNQADFSYNVLADFDLVDSDSQEVEHNDSYSVSWFELNLSSAASVDLDTVGSLTESDDVLDTILALYNNDGSLVAQNDNCSALITSCLSIPSLSAGS